MDIALSGGGIIFAPSCSGKSTWLEARQAEGLEVYDGDHIAGYKLEGAPPLPVAWWNTAKNDFVQRRTVENVVEFIEHQPSAVVLWSSSPEFLSAIAVDRVPMSAVFIDEAVYARRVQSRIDDVTAGRGIHKHIPTVAGMVRAFGFLRFKFERMGVPIFNTFDDAYAFMTRFTRRVPSE